MHGPTVKAIFRSGADPIGYRQRLGSRTGGLIHRFRPRRWEEHQRIERLVAVPAVKIGQEVGHRIESSFQRVCQPSRQGSSRITGEGTVQVVPVLRHYLLCPSIKTGRIGQRQEDHVPGQLRRVQLCRQTAQSLDAHILAAVDSCRDH